MEVDGGASSAMCSHPSDRAVLVGLGGPEGRGSVASAELSPPAAVSCRMMSCRL